MKVVYVEVLFGGTITHPDFFLGIRTRGCVCVCVGLVGNVMCRAFVRDFV